METNVASKDNELKSYTSSLKDNKAITSSSTLKNQVSDGTSTRLGDASEVETVDLSADVSVEGDTGVISVDEITTVSVKDQLSELQSTLNARVEELEAEVSALDDEYNTYLLNLQNPIPFMQDFNDDNLKKAQELEAKLAPLKEELMNLESIKKQLDHSIELSPYVDKMNTSEYAEFVENYSCDYQDLDYDYLRDYSFDVTMYIEKLMTEYSRDELIEMHANEIDEIALIEYVLKNKPDNVDSDTAIYLNPYLTDLYERYKFMTDDEIMMYHYLFSTQGKDAAETYMSLIEDDINQAMGTAKALEFINGLDLNDEGKLEDSLKNLFGVSGKGLVDGIDNFFDGLANVIQNNDKLTVDDYEKMIILSYLSENSVYHDEIYEFSSALGNMVPAMVASAVATFIATPAGGATVAGITLSATQVGAVTASTLMGLSAMGNAKHQALVNGSDVLSSTNYGIFVGASEATLGYFLGNIPGISQTAGFTLRGILQEGFEEFSQEWIDAGLQAVILGKDVDWSQVPESAMKSFLMGVLMSGFLNGGQEAISMVIDGTSVNINVEDILEYMHENNETDISVALEAMEPGIFDMLFRRNSDPTQARMTDEQITNELARLSNNNYQKIPDAIESLLRTYASNGRNNFLLRQICRISIEYMKANGYTPTASANIISQIYYGILNDIGFQSYTDPDSGIEINILNNINWANQGFDVNTVMNQINSLPPEVRALVKEINFFDTFNPYDYYWELRYNQYDFHSTATGGDGIINFWDTNMYYANVVPHEIGHTIDTKWAVDWGVETDHISESQMWIDAMQSDLATTGLTGVTEYARSAYAGSGNLHEDFAECISLFYTNPNALDAFPARKAILMQYLPRIETMATTYDQVYDILVDKYGEEETDWRLQQYYDTGDINYITRDGGARDLLSKFSHDEFIQYMDQLKTTQLYDKNMAIEGSIILCFNSLVDKYGYDQAIRNMQEFINTGNKNLITSRNGARDSIVYSIEEYREVFKMMNHGSLNVSYYFPNQ